jgi:putative FmdB family regulatory protein
MKRGLLPVCKNLLTIAADMPIYEYRCKKCGKDFELLVFGEGNKASCEHCGSKSVEKKFSAFAVGNTAGSQGTPDCAPACGDGFTRGSCGSGMCCGGKG